METSSAVSGTDFTWERKPHPMCIPHIVDNILNNLRVEDLKTCRLVSSQYNEIACKNLQREETIVFKSILQLETYVSKIKPISQRCRGCSSSASLCSELSSLSTEYDSAEDVTVDEDRNGSESDECWPYFENIFSDSLSSSHSHDDDYCYYNSLYYYSHRSFHFDYCDPPTDLETVDHFFRIFGQQIHRLKYTTDLLPYNFPRLLGHMGDVWQDRLKNLEELILEMKWGVPAHLFGDRNETNHVVLPRLRKLNLDVLLTDTDADRAQTFFQELLAVTPNLEEISIPGSKRFFDDYINCVLTQVIISSELPRLSILNFCLALSDAQMRLLTVRSFPLTTLILDLVDVDIRHEDQIHNAEEANELGNNDDHEQEFVRQNNNRRPSFAPITKSTLQRFMSSLANSLESLHVCFPQSPQHHLHTFKFTTDMTELKFLALGYYAGPSLILDHLPALNKLELWNVHFQDCHVIGKVVPEKYRQITSVIS